METGSKDDEDFRQIAAPADDEGEIYLRFLRYKN